MCEDCTLTYHVAHTHTDTQLSLCISSGETDKIYVLVTTIGYFKVFVGMNVLVCATLYDGLAHLFRYDKMYNEVNTKDLHMDLHIVVYTNL